MKELSLVINQPDEGKFLQKIGWNKEQIKSVVSEITEQYEGLTYTEEQLQDAKKDRATLNALKKDLSDRRIMVKKALMAPYDVFEAEVKEVVAMIDKPIMMIDKQVNEYEEKAKREKEGALIEYFNSDVGELGEFLKFEMIFNPKWLNKSISLKTCKDEISAEISRTSDELVMLERTIEEKYRDYAKDFYFRNNRNITVVLNEIGRMREIDQKKEEARLAKEAEERLAEAERAVESTQTPEEAQEEIKLEESKAEQTAKPVEEVDAKIYKASFEIIGTKAQILSVKEFMLQNNIQFGKVEK